MCGLVGITSRYANGFTHKEAAMFAHMLFVDTLRGWDSTGVFSVNEHGNVSIKKAAMEGPDFIHTKEFENFSRDLVRDGVFACGHNRAATRGSITDKNAHPFWVDDKIILMQNGTMFGDHKKHKDVEVDSEAIAHVLSEEPDIEKALQKINAAYALVWYSTEQEELYIVRNDQRPLYISYFKDNGMVWASEKETILFAASKAGIELREEPYMLKDNHLITIKLGQRGKYTYTSKDIDCNYKGQSFQDDVYGYYPVSPWVRQHAVAYENQPVTDDDVLTKTARFVQGSNRCDSYHNRRTFGDILGTDPHLAQYLFDDMLTAARACRELMEKRDFRQTVVVEPIDFIPAGISGNNKDWYLFGAVLTPDGQKSGPTPLIHWYVSGKTIAEMLDMTTKFLYTVELKTHVLSNLTHKNAVSATLYGHNPVPIKCEVPENSAAQ